MWAMPPQPHQTDEGQLAGIWGLLASSAKHSHRALKVDFSAKSHPNIMLDQEIGPALTIDPAQYEGGALKRA